MIKKLHAISVYDYINLLCEETGSKWNDNDTWLITKDLYKEQCNNKDNEKIQTSD